MKEIYSDHGHWSQPSWFQRPTVINWSMYNLMSAMAITISQLVSSEQSFRFVLMLKHLDGVSQSHSDLSYHCLRSRSDGEGESLTW